jgi:hypothetical protein
VFFASEWLYAFALDQASLNPVAALSLFSAFMLLIHCVKCDWLSVTDISNYDWN